MQFFLLLFIIKEQEKKQATQYHQHTPSEITSEHWVSYVHLFSEALPQLVLDLHTSLDFN